MTFSQAPEHTPRLYTLVGQILANVWFIKYLGITISEYLSWSLHVSDITNKANSSLAFLRHILKSCPQSLKELAYISMVHSILEYICPIWDPHLSGDIDKLKRVQRLATWFIKLDYNFTSSIIAMLNEVGWDSLEERQQKVRLGLFFKWYMGMLLSQLRMHFVAA